MKTRYSELEEAARRFVQAERELHDARADITGIINIGWARPSLIKIDWAVIRRIGQDELREQTRKELCQQMQLEDDSDQASDQD